MSEREPRSSHRIPLLGGPAPLPPPAPSSTVDVEDRVIASLDLGAAFDLACAELGFAAASWLFVEQVAALEGKAAVAALRDELGPTFSVLDFVATRWLAGEPRTPVESAPVIEALSGTRRILVVGLEANHLDVLLRDLDPSIRVGLLTFRMQRVDWDRVLGNHDGRVEAVDVAEFQGWAGARSAMLTFIYGSRGRLMHVLPAFLRVAGPDVRTQFRDIVGWNVLGGALELYPRHLVETPTSDLTLLVPGGPGET